MAILLHKQKGWGFTGMGKLAMIGFISSIALALVDTIWIIYLDSFVNSVVITGFISSIFTLIAFLFYFLSIPIIEKHDKSKIFSFTLLMFALTYFLFTINTKFYFVVVLGFFATLLQTLRLTSFGIIVKDKSSEKQLSRNEGLRYAFMNLAWVIGPLIAGFVADKSGINMVFVLSAIFIFISFMLFKFSGIKDVNIKKKTDNNFFRNFRDFFKKKERIVAYVLGGGVNLWWSLNYIFIPLLIIRSGLGTIWVGYFLFAIAVPLILFEYYFSKLAGKIGFKKIFKTGFLIPAIFSFICFFIVEIHFILALLVLASVGLAMLEATTEAYFFDISKGKENTRFYGPYNTTMSLNLFIGKVASSLLLIFLPFKFLFLLYALFMFALFLVSSRMKNVIEGRRDGKKN